MINNFLNKNDLPPMGDDGIYGEEIDYGDQILELETREKVTKKINKSFLNEISRHHSIPVMDYEVKNFIKVIPTNGYILDVGGCWGWHWRNLKNIRPDIKVFIVDFLRSNLEIAKIVLEDSINNNIFLIHANAIKLPFKTSFFDGLWSVQTTQHIPKIDLVYKEFHRVLKKDGILSDYNLNHSILQKLIHNLLGKSYIEEGEVKNTFFLRRANKNSKALLFDIFQRKVFTRYTEIIFSPEYKLPLGGGNSSFIGKIDSYLSKFGYYLRFIARQRSFHIKK